MALRPIRGEPGKFIDEVTGVEYSIREMKMDDKYDVLPTIRDSTTERPPWWRRVREFAALQARELGRGEPCTSAQGALYLAHIQELCHELDVSREKLSASQNMENTLWNRRNELQRTVNDLQKTLAATRRRNPRGRFAREVRRSRKGAR